MFFNLSLIGSYFLVTKPHARIGETKQSRLFETA